MTFGRHEQELNDALKEIRAERVDVIGLTADTSNPDDIHQVFQQVDQHLGGLDILINNAALAYQSIIEGVTRTGSTWSTPTYAATWRVPTRP